MGTRTPDTPNIRYYTGDTVSTSIRRIMSSSVVERFRMCFNLRLQWNKYFLLDEMKAGLKRCPTGGPETTSNPWDVNSWPPDFHTLLQLSASAPRDMGGQGEPWLGGHRVPTQYCLYCVSRERKANCTDSGHSEVGQFHFKYSHIHHVHICVSLPLFISIFLSLGRCFILDCIALWPTYTVATLILKQ